MSVPVQCTCLVCWQTRASGHMIWTPSARPTWHAHSQLYKLRYSLSLSAWFASLTSNTMACDLLALAQALQFFLVQWRTGKIKNPSAYLTDLLAKSYRDNTWTESNSLHFMDAPASITTKVPSAPTDIGLWGLLLLLMGGSSEGMTGHPSVCCCACVMRL